MNIKKILLFLLVVALLVLTFFASYKITVSLRTPDEETTESTSLNEETTGEETTIKEESTSESGNEETSASAPVELTQLPTPKTVSMPEDDNWSTVLLNAYYKMDSSYEPRLEEVVEGSGIYLDYRVAEKFTQMYNAALKDSVTLTPASGYVSLDRQTRNFTKQVESLITLGNSEEKSEVMAIYSVLPAGCSEHNYGLAIDIGWIADSFASSPAYEWLTKNAADYGFVERYTSNKEEYTHYQASPWHWRYVGVDAAKAMADGKLCLEEYLGKIN